jgi:alpha-beta hydrolase superfamily lysophospholipase
VPNEGSRLLYAQCASQDKTLRIYEGGYHELWNDIEKADVMAGICDWLAAHI